MNFIDYCIATKNFSALNAVKEYNKCFSKDYNGLDKQARDYLRDERNKIAKEALSLSKSEREKYLGNTGDKGYYDPSVNRGTYLKTQARKDAALGHNTRAILKEDPTLVDDYYKTKPNSLDRSAVNQRYVKARQKANLVNNYMYDKSSKQAGIEDIGGPFFTQYMNNNRFEK